jgi:phosphoribosylanthranilate isomerase
MAIKVQIYEIQSAEDARLCIDLGVNFIGVVTGEYGHLKNDLDFAACRNIFAAVPPHVTKNSLTVSPHVGEIIETIRATRPDVIHISGKIDHLTPDKVAEIKRAEPLVKIMQAIPVGGPGSREISLKFARDYSRLADYFILDTMRDTLDAIGATGHTHDWSISADIVRMVNIPVILAGGLTPENVTEAVRSVRPFGVDSFTYTNLPNSPLKDPQKVAAFVANANAA